MPRKLIGFRALPCDLGYLSLFRTEGCWEPLLPGPGLILPVLTRMPPKRAMPHFFVTPACYLLSMLVTESIWMGHA